MLEKHLCRATSKAVHMEKEKQHHSHTSMLCTRAQLPFAALVIVAVLVVYLFPVKTSVHTLYTTVNSTPEADNETQNRVGNLPAPSGNAGGGDGFEEVVPDLSQYSDTVLPEVAEQVLEMERQGKGRKIIAMSVFGSNPRYVDGAILNAVLAKRDWHAHGWVLRIYYGEGVPQDAINTLLSLGVEMVEIKTAQNARASTYWRFFALEDRTATRIISRDADAQLSQRDLAAVNEWVESGHFFHTLHDHNWHGAPVLAGMWGAVAGFVNPRVIEQWRQSNDDTKQIWRNDQAWLASVVWPKAKHYTLDHSSFLCGRYGAVEWRGFPTKRWHPKDFVGNVYEPGTKFSGGDAPLQCEARCRRKPEWDTC